MPTNRDNQDGVPPPLFTAAFTCAKQAPPRPPPIYMLLRCINFAPKTQVQISAEGLRFSAHDSSIMEGKLAIETHDELGHAFLDKSLFTHYTFNPPPRPSSPSSTSSSRSPTPVPSSPPSIPAFDVSLPALLETLQLATVSAITSTSTSSDGAISTHQPSSSFMAAALDGATVTLTYASLSAPLTLRVVDPAARITTRCELTTYEPDAPGSFADEDATMRGGGEIPFARDRLQLKVIMPAQGLAEAVAEIGATGAERLVVRGTPVGRRGRDARGNGSNRSGGLEFEGRGGALGDAVVTFAAEEGARGTTAGGAPGGGGFLETFQVARRCAEMYSFELIKRANRAMLEATKVSIRGDAEGVLSLQFMIETGVAEGAGGQRGGPPGLAGVGFVDFRFVPFIGEDEDEDYGDEDEGEEEDEDEETEEE
ncbi:repair protein Rad1/Rec1/Rad17-domain-containing protein [Lineolata rhizophorae]|uniref:Repair protein Rad1/Rec1/Rad17-domain-containing protein n=1 Tax=Lineolata rhizophorae TaxID=578093 RepID=A0A6A6NSQ0_9PEZI|nr:repair protein Rad1/Rec1/Rad17-domain-containing protein [Lineolata rhizophorae]